MSTIKSFKELGISTPEPRSFIGEKIPVKKVIGKQIIIHDFKVVPSNYSGNRLDLQISLNDDKRVIFTSSSYLSETMKQIPKDAFPFTTIIIEENDRFKLT